MEDRAVDHGAWDGGAAMKACKTAADYNSICAGKKAGDPALRSSHALPHHYLGKGPNADGTRNALSRLPQTQGLTNAAAAKSHLEAHMREIQGGSRAATDDVACMECGAMNNTDAVFCDQCGRSMGQAPVVDDPYTPDAGDTVKCQSCGKMNDPDAKFCDQCGAAMEVSPGAGGYSSALPTGDLFRAIYPGAQLRELRNEGPVLHGHFARFNEWTEIDSEYEGRFMESIAPGSFAASFRSLTPKILFQHGRDPELGDKVLGSPVSVHEDDEGAAYEVPLFRSVPPLLVDGLRAGAYGASFRFSVTGERVVRQPKPSAYNPEGLPERTITSAMVSEAGPVTFPAYAGASAGIRSMTDQFRPRDLDAELARMVRDHPRDLAIRIERLRKGTEEKPHEDQPPPARFRSREDWEQWLTRI